jgi:CRP-like cAMP-binding protein
VLVWADVFHGRFGPLAATGPRAKEKMAPDDRSTVRNRILSALPEREYKDLLPHLTPVIVPLGETIYKPESQIKQVYFLNEGVVSHVTHLEDGGSIEVGLVGFQVVLGDDRSPDHAIVQIANTGFRMEASVLREKLTRDGRLRELLLRFVLVMNKQVAQTAACNGSHTVNARLARWLLMCHDRVEGDVLRLTQEFIAQMLGIRRSGVSESAIMLQSLGVITYTRGTITVLDRTGLENSACECYGAVKAEIDRLYQVAR